MSEDNPCVGICEIDESGYCIGCGRPPWPVNDQGIATASDENPLRHTSLRYFNVVGSADPTVYDTSPHNLFPIVFEALLAGVVIIGAVVVTRSVVVNSLAPLNRLAATATTVSNLPLESGEVEGIVRVPQRDTDPVSEVGRVGLAFNHMLDNVEGALGARHASEVKLRQFVADASHELRNPLAAIRGYAELTRRERDQVSDTMSHALTRIESESDRMSTLVEDLLLLARLDSGPALDVRATDLTEIVLNATSDARVAGPDHTWTLSLPDEPVYALGDRYRLHQVLANLLANAVRFSRCDRP